MRKTVLTAATVAMSAALAGLAFAAAPDDSPTTDTSVVPPVSTTTGTTSAGTTSTGATSAADRSTADRSTADDRGRGSDDVNDAPDDSDGRVGGGHGSDDGNEGSDDSSGRDGGGHGSDD
jgi:hypothetical protein